MDYQRDDVFMTSEVYSEWGERCAKEVVTQGICLGYRPGREGREGIITVPTPRLQARLLALLLLETRRPAQPWRSRAG